MRGSGAGERTELAWTRSSLSLAAIAGLMLHAGLAAGAHPLALTAAAGLLCAATAVWRHGTARYRRAAAQPDARAITAMTALTLATAAVVLALVIGS